MIQDEWLFWQVVMGTELQRAEVEAMFIEELLDELDVIDVWADMAAHTQWALVRKDRSK